MFLGLCACSFEPRSDSLISTSGCFDIISGFNAQRKSTWSSVDVASNYRVACKRGLFLVDAGVGNLRVQLVNWSKHCDDQLDMQRHPATVICIFQVDTTDISLVTLIPR